MLVTDRSARDLSTTIHRERFPSTLAAMMAIRTIVSNTVYVAGVESVCSESEMVRFDILLTLLFFSCSKIPVLNLLQELMF